ncbi:hypothetical protein SB758_23230 [Burkholderia sp. SIMBA_013]
MELSRSSAADRSPIDRRVGDWPRGTVELEPECIDDENHGRRFGIRAPIMNA